MLKILSQKAFEACCMHQMLFGKSIPKKHLAYAQCSKMLKCFWYLIVCNDLTFSSFVLIRLSKMVDSLISCFGILGFITLIGWDLIAGNVIGYETIMTALVIGLSLLTIVLFGNFVGAMLPFILSRMGLDPAVSSAPFVATIVDVSGIIIYFSIALFFLSELLL